MNSRVQNLSIAQLRSIAIHEMRKLATALEYGGTISDLQEVREHVRSLVDLLCVKEIEAERRIGVVEAVPQLS